jgi:hypothetical protein
VPARPRHLTDDCTPEKLGTLLGENEERMAVLSDEGSIFPLIFGRYSGMPNYEIYLKSYQGSPHPIDRGGRTGELLEEPLLTLGISAQPEVIKGIGAQEDARGRGLVGRFIYSRPESLLGQRPGDAPPLDPELQQDYTNRLRHLLALERAVIDGRSCAHTLKLSERAYACWVRLHDALEEEMGRDGAFHGFTDWAGKLCGQVVRVAGILHMAEHATVGRAWHAEISEATFRAAVPIGLYMIQHARAALGMMRSAVGHEDARKVLAWITREPDASVEFKRTQAIRGTRLAAEDLTKALGVLEEHGYIQPAPGEREGKRAPVPARYLVNPVARTPQGEAQPARRQPFATLLSQFAEEAVGMLLGESDNCSNNSNYSRGAEPSAPPRPGALDALLGPVSDNCSNNSNYSARPEPQQGEAATPPIGELTLAWPCCGGRVSRFSAKWGGSVCARCQPND